ncbi:hypothetical protein ACFWY5_37180 [Nonomuraea sp. NPDC059007]|uniref:hypothetical protein n=1 Tax=Nonomuraea sp. NPDC059007 TaxID=3346692 RepID=UPI00367C949D
MDENITKFKDMLQFNPDCEHLVVSWELFEPKDQSGTAKVTVVCRDCRQSVVKWLTAE